MKKVLVSVVMVFAIVAVGQQPSAQPGSTPANQKVIKDPGEYNAYVTALNMQDPAQKAVAMEAFVKQYPQSVMLVDALEQAMAGYQRSNNPAKVEEMAKRILQLQPNHISALAVVVALDRVKATQGDKGALTEGCNYSQTGLQQLPGWQKPEGMTDPDFVKLRDQMSQIFNGAAGFCALQKKDYANARTYYLKAIQNDPSDLQDTYQLSIAYLETDPIDLTGFWYGAKAISIAGNNAAAVNAIAPYIKGKFKRYHGGKPEDWDQFAAAVAPQTAPPSAAELAKLIPPAPTPCDFAVQAVKDNKPEELSFSDKEFILSKSGCSPANKAAADTVWQSIQTMEKGGEARLEIPIKVISATKESLDVAISDDNQTNNKADAHVILEKPLTTRPPAPGTMTKVTGVLTSYTPDPFMFTMEKGALPAPPKKPVHHPVRKKK